MLHKLGLCEFESIVDFWFWNTSFIVIKMFNKLLTTSDCEWVLSRDMNQWTSNMCQIWFSFPSIALQLKTSIPDLE